MLLPVPKRPVSKRFVAFFVAFIVVAFALDVFAPNPPLPRGPLGTAIAVLAVFSPVLIRSWNRYWRAKRDR